MPLVLLDSAGVSFLSRRSAESADYLRSLVRRKRWPPVVPTAVLVECLYGDPARDALTNMLLRNCEIWTTLPLSAARRAAQLRTMARTGSAVDAIVVALAEPDGIVVTSDPDDLTRLAAFAPGVRIERV